VPSSTGWAGIHSGRQSSLVPSTLGVSGYRSAAAAARSWRLAFIHDRTARHCSWPIAASVTGDMSHRSALRSLRDEPGDRLRIWLAIFARSSPETTARRRAARARCHRAAPGAGSTTTCSAGKTITRRTVRRPSRWSPAGRRYSWASARIGRSSAGRVRFLAAECGIRQFLDIGTACRRPTTPMKSLRRSHRKAGSPMSTMGPNRAQPCQCAAAKHAGGTCQYVQPTIRDPRRSWTRPPRRSTSASRSPS